MAHRRYLGVLLGNLASWVDQKRFTHRAGVLYPKSLFLAPSAICHQRYLSLVGQQTKIQMMLCCKLGVTRDRILRNSYDIQTFLTQYVIIIPKTAGLQRAPGSIVFGIEIKY